MKNKMILAGFAAAALFAGCSKASIETPPTEGLAIAAKAALGVESQVSPMMSSGTRAALTGTSMNGETARVIASITTGNYGTAYADGTMTFAAEAVNFNAAGFTGNKTLPGSGDLFIMSLYPDTGWGTPTTSSSFTFTGIEDVMAAPQNTLTSGGTTQAAFAFVHLLTKVDVNLKADDAAAIDVWGKVTDIKVTEVLSATTFKNAVNVTLAGTDAATLAPASAFTGTATGWKTYTEADAEFTGQTLALTADAALASTTIMAPFTAVATAGTVDLQLSVTTENSGGAKIIDVTLPTGSAGNTQGKAIKVTLNFKSTEISGTATVTDWVTVEVPPIDVQ